MITDRRIDAHIAPSVQDFIRTVAPPPDWLQKAWTSAKHSGLDSMTLDEINAEISASRREKKAGAPEVMRETGELIRPVGPATPD